MMGPKVVIIGGGLTGLSAARSLTRRNVRDIVLLERAELASAGTGKSSGIIRCHYGVPSLAAMAWKSLPFFESAGAGIGFEQTGYVVAVSADNSEPLRANVACHQKLGIEAEIVGPDEVAALLPRMSLDGLDAFAHEPRGGYADASQTALAFLREALAGGAKTQQRAPVSRLQTEGDRVTGVVLSDGAVIRCDVVVVAAGVWSADLLSPLGIDFPVHTERSEVVIVRAREALRGMAVVSDLATLQYIRPDTAHGLLVGNSDHSDPQFADPDDYSNQISTERLEMAVGKLLLRFPTLEEAIVQTVYAGCYDVTPDYNPVIAAVEPTNLILAAGFSGHGFKISPAVGDLVADLVLHGESLDPHIPSRDFRLSRFSEGNPLTSAHPYAGASQMR